MGHSINMVHSCIAMLQVQTMQSRLSGKILILIKIIKKFFLLNPFEIIILEWPPLIKLEVTPHPQPRKCMDHALMSMKDTASFHADFFSGGSCNSKNQHDLSVKIEVWLLGWNHYKVRGSHIIKIYGHT